MTGASPARNGEAARGLRRVVANATALLGAYALPRFFTAAAVIFAARTLGPSNFGAYGTAAAFAVILSIIATLGMQPLLVREIARDPGRAADWLRSAHVAKTASAVLMLAILVEAGLLLGYSRDVLVAAALLGAGYAVGSYAENLGAWFQAVEQMHVWMQASALYGIITGLTGIALVLATHRVIAFAAAPLAGQSAALAWLWLRSPRSTRRGRVDRAGLTLLLRQLWPFAGAFVAMTAFSKTDVLLLERWHAAAEVGRYAAAYKFIDITQALATVAAAAVYPRLSRGDPGGAGARLTELALLASMPAAGALYLARRPVVAFLFGAGYEEAAAITALFAGAVPPLVIAIVGGYVLAAAGAMASVAALYVILLVVKVSLNVALVPSHGARGAGIAMLASELLLAGGMLVLLARRSTALRRRIWMVALLCVAAWAGAARLPGPGLSIPLFLTAVAATFAAGRVFGADDRAVLAEAVRQWRAERARP